MGKKQGFTEKLKNIILFPMNVRTVFYLLGATALNIAGHYFMEMVKGPFWLDTFGTMAIAIAFGPFAGAVVGALSLIIMGMINSISFFYIPVGILIGVLVGFLFPKKEIEDRNFGIVSLAILCGLLSAAFSTPIDIIKFNGYTGNVWGDALFDMLNSLVNSSRFNSMAAELFVELPDRVVSIFLAICIVRFVKSIRENRSERRRKKAATAAMIFLLGMVLPFLSTIRTDAAGDVSDYEEVEFDSRDGILTSEINAVEQTKDGYLWVGTYAGLYRYDGVRFETIELHKNIRNVKTLFLDSEGRLWIGTNDSGVVCYNPSTRESVSYSTENGLAADSIRSFGEDEKGNIYVGTDRELARISTGGKIKNYSEWPEIMNVKNVTTTKDGVVIGVTNSGILFVIKDNLLVQTFEYRQNESVGFNAVACADDLILVGTSADSVEKYRFDGNTLKFLGRIRSDEATYFNKIEYSSRMEMFFYCCDNGMGYIDKSASRIVALSGNKNYGTVSDVLVDRQGNVWFASSKNGLIRFSNSPFKNILRGLGSDGQVVNALYEENGKLYIGTDAGLRIVDLKKHREVNDPVVEEIGSSRVRNIYKDSKDNLWFSLYANQGLLCLTKSGEIRTVENPDNYVVSPKIRFVTELSDGRILVSGNKGISFVKNNKYVGYLGEKEGLNNTTILSVYEREDKTIMAASDGDGIYLIQGDRIAGHIGKDEGLDTGVVMKIIPCSGGRLYITSNALYFDNNEVIKRLENFPYNNNFDILFDENRNAWITSSAGLYVVAEQDLLSDGNYNCTLLNSDWGLVTTFTANSFNLMKDDELYLCCTEGVRTMPITAYDSFNTSYQLHLKEVKTEEETINEIGDRIVIPATTGRIRFDIAVTNYTLSNPLIRYYLDGSGDEGTTCYQNEITPLYFTSLNHGKYVFRIQVLDELNGRVIKENKVYVEKEAQMYELLYFRIYLLLILSLGISYLGWLLYVIQRKSAKVIGLQKEIVTDPMTGILNKNGSQKALTKACSEEEGILLMIDLDSFKLVNDLYGHDMGDKVLIRFAELIKEAEKEGDIAGRLGGDEFVGFLKNTQSEEDVERVCDALNNGIVQAAKEMMGDDMKIPLGASIGAIRVPAEGTEYEEVFPLADKALYSVKQNGKHGYAFYRKNTDSASDENSQANDLGKIKKIIGERNEGKGAYNVNFDKMQVLYRFMCRNDRENRGSTGFFRLRVEGTPGASVTDEAREAFGEVLTCNLKRNDVISVYSGDYYVLLVGGDPSSYESAIKRVIDKWKESEEYGKFPVKYETGSVD